jgi:hypothetical protein
MSEFIGVWPQETFVGPDGNVTHGPFSGSVSPTFDLRYTGRLYLQTSGLGLYVLLRTGGKIMNFRLCGEEVLMLGEIFIAENLPVLSE